MPNVIVTSHRAFPTEEALSNIAETTVQNRMIILQVVLCTMRLPCRAEPNARRTRWDAGRGKHLFLRLSAAAVIRIGTVQRCNLLFEVIDLFPQFAELLRDRVGNVYRSRSSTLRPCRRTMRAGIPTAVLFSGMSVGTTAPAAILQLSAMVSGPSTLAPQPTNTLLPKVGCRLPQSLPVPPSVTPSIKRAVVADLGCLADDNAHAVVYKRPFPI